MLLFRKIDETRWFGKRPLESLSVTELNTKDNELSVWMDYRKVYDMDLALAFILTQSCFSDVWCVKIPEERLKEKGIALRQENSRTCFVRMQPFHTNILVPTISELGSLSEIIHDLVQNPEINCRYFPVNDLKAHYYAILRQDLITIDFNMQTNKGKWDVLKEMEKKFGRVDFSQLKKAVPLINKK